MSGQQSVWPDIKKRWPDIVYHTVYTLCWVCWTWTSACTLVCNLHYKSAPPINDNTCQLCATKALIWPPTIVRTWKFCWHSMKLTWQMTKCPNIIINLAVYIHVYHTGVCIGSRWCTFSIHSKLDKDIPQSVKFLLLALMPNHQVQMQHLRYDGTKFLVGKSYLNIEDNSEHF